MNTATELLTRAYEALDRFAIYDDLRDEIEVFLAAEPAIRKPMTEEEIDEELETNEYYCAKSFEDGVRFAEKHHFKMQSSNEKN